MMGVQTTSTSDVVSVPDDAVISVAYGPSAGSGLLVISIDGQQFTVCDDVWSTESANVACKNSGFT